MSLRDLIPCLALPWVLGLAGCLGEPGSVSCAEQPDAPGCGPADAMPDRAPDAEPDPDAGPDMRPTDEGLGPDDGVFDMDRPDVGEDGGPDMSPADGGPDMAPDMAAPGCVAEQCNAADDDCDGRIDEGLDGLACINGVGECASAGAQTCSAGAWLCDAPVGLPVPEVCNGRDDDCDGVADEAQRFTSAEVRIGAMPADRPEIAAIGEIFAVARPVASEQAQAEGVEPPWVMALDLVDRRGQPVEGITVGEGARAISAWALTRFANGGDVGFLLVWAEDRVDAAGAVSHRIEALVAFPAAGGFGDIDGPLTLLEAGAQIGSIDAVAGPRGVGVAWTAANAARFGYIDFEQNVPALDPVRIGGDLLGQIDAVAIGQIDGRFYIATTSGQQVMRTRELSVAWMDPGAVGPGGSIEIADAVGVGEPAITTRGDAVFVAWSAGGQVHFAEVDAGLRSKTTFEVTADEQRSAGGPRLVADADEVALGWSWIEGRESEVYVARMFENRGVWAPAAPIRISNAEGRSGPMDLALDDLFGVVWYDERLDGREADPAAWFRAGPLACEEAAPQ